MKNEKLISVIIPVYNRPNLIKRAIDSVINQTYKFFEIIVIDNGSTDNTADIVEKNYKSVNLIRQNHTGVASARNKGIINSKGKYIAFLDSDDEWLPEKLNIQIKDFFNNQNCKISHTDELWIRKGMKVNKPKKYEKFGGYIFSRCLDVTMVGTSTVMLKKEVFNEVGMFDEKMPVCEDNDLWLRIALKYEFNFIKKQLTIKYGGHGDQLSTCVPFQNQWRVHTMYKILKNKLTDKKEYIYALREKLHMEIEIILSGLEKKNKFSIMKKYETIRDELDFL